MSSVIIYMGVGFIIGLLIGNKSTRDKIIAYFKKKSKKKSK